MQSNFGIREERETLIGAFFSEGGASYHGIFAFIVFILLNLTRGYSDPQPRVSMGRWTQILAVLWF